MKKILFTMLGLVLISGTTAMAQNGWADEGLKGSVLMVKQRCHEVLSAQGGVPQKGSMVNCIARNEDYVFNKRGQCAEASGIDVSDNMEWKATYSYNLGENKAELLLKSASGSILSKTAFNYNEVGNVSEERLLNPQGDLQEKLVYEYNDSNGVRVSASCFKPDGGLRWKESYEYDRLGNKTAYKHYDSKGNLDWQTLYKYDKLGSKIEEGSYDMDNNELSRTLYEYVYDDHDNWTRQTIFIYDLNQNKVPENIVERDITYY